MNCYVFTIYVVFQTFQIQNEQNIYEYSPNYIIQNCILMRILVNVIYLFNNCVVAQCIRCTDCGRFQLLFIQPEIGKHLLDYLLVRRGNNEDETMTRERVTVG